MAKPATRRRKKLAPRRGERRSPTSIRPTHDERLDSLERRVSAIEATLNGRLAAISERLDHVAEGIRASNVCNGYIVRELQESRAARGQEPSESLDRANAAGEAWMLKPSSK
jgi:hypothetical protein